MLTTGQVLAIAHSSASVDQLAERYQVSRSVVLDIRSGRTWSRVTGIQPPPTPTQLRGARMLLNARCDR